MMKIDIAFFTCDKYKDLWPHFFELFVRNFPLEAIGCFYIHTDNETDYKFPTEIEHKVFINKTNDFIDKLSNFIDDSTADYFLFLLDDYFIDNKIDSCFINDVLAFVKNKDCNYLKLNFKSSKPLGKKCKVNGNKYAIIKTEQPYSIDLYPSIWKKDFVRDTCINWPYSKRTIWDYEGKFNRLTSIMPLNPSYCYLGNKFSFIDVIRKGKLRREANKALIKKYNINLLPGRQLMTKKESFLDIVVPFVSRWLPSKIKEKIKKKQNKKGKIFFSDDE